MRVPADPGGGPRRAAARTPGKGAVMARPEITNWGRFGPDDELGMLNLQTPESILAAVRLVKKGLLYNLAVPLEKDGPQYASFHKTWRVTHFTKDPTPGAFNVADDVVTMEAHSGTHVDALGHFWRDGELWNGKSEDHVTSYGLEWAAIHNVRGFVGRGVMLDLPRFRGVRHLGLGEVVTVDDMEGCARAQGVEIRPGDALLLRTGWYTVFHEDRALWEQGEPGPDASCTAWLQAKDVIALGADNAGVESAVYATRTRTTPRLHVTTLRDLGVYLFEHLDLEALARDRVHEFLFVAAPLRLMRATGAGFSPLALV
jgi:kynurenine formamidase